MHAKWLGHSAFDTHCGLQLGGVPMKFSKHVQEGISDTSRHWEFGPHGVGWQGFFGVLSSLGFSIIIWQEVNGSPVCLTKQVQIGTWFTTEHLALYPQVPGQGSTQRWLTHAKSNEHSWLLVHSGRQSGGCPLKPGMHEHTGWVLLSRHCELGPQGDGLQGVVWAISANLYLKQKFNVKNNYVDNKYVFTWEDVTRNKRIACIIFWTWTHGHMINNLTDSIGATCSRTWILTFMLDAGLISFTICIQNTF